MHMCAPACIEYIPEGAHKNVYICICVCMCMCTGVHLVHVLEGYTVYLLCLQLSMQRYKGTMDDNIQPTLRRG